MLTRACLVKLPCLAQLALGVDPMVIRLAVGRKAVSVDLSQQAERVQFGRNAPPLALRVGAKLGGRLWHITAIRLNFRDDGPMFAIPFDDLQMRRFRRSASGHESTC